MGEKSQEEIAQELADELSRAADLKKQEADILQNIAFHLDLEGAPGLKEMFEKYENIEIEIDVIDEMKNKYNKQQWD